MRKTPQITIIVAISQNYAIGNKNDLLWHISGDLKRFKQITTGHTIVMGSKTYKSLPRRPLPNRRHIIITRKKNADFDGCIVVNSIKEAIDNMETNNENFIIGGGEIYKQFLPFSTKIYLTIVEKHYEADTFFPELNWDEWNIESEEACEDGDLKYKNLIIVRK